MKEIDCIFCDIPSSEILIEENGFAGRRCPVCNLIYISPRPSFDEIVDLYGHDDAHVSAEDHIGSEYSKRLNAKHALAVIQKYIKKGSLLEIGSGAGYFLDEARERGFSPHGIEFNPIQARHIREVLKLPCQETPLSELVSEEKKYDLIYHCDVISHLYDPVEDFHRMNQVLNEGGYVVFETGNLGEVKKKYFSMIRSFMYPDHLFFFNTDNLHTLLTSTGFKVIDIERHSLIPFLNVLKFIGKGRRLVKRSADTDHGGTPDDDKPATPVVTDTSSNTSPSSRASNSRAKNASALFRHHLRYTAGKLWPATGRPQTMIVIAQKATAASRGRPEP